MGFYLNKKYYNKCDRVLNETNELKSIGILLDNRLLEKAKETEEKTRKLISTMEEKKQEIEISSQMYKFIDKAYTWALDGMKFVAMLDMERCQSSEECQKMIEEFDEYMSEHPAITADEFKDTLALAHRFGNKKCIAQCEFAQDKCSETKELFSKRRDILIKA